MPTERKQQKEDRAGQMKCKNYLMQLFLPAEPAIKHARFGSLLEQQMR
jgi:hypothetical protein